MGDVIGRASGSQEGDDQEVVLLSIPPGEKHEGLDVLVRQALRDRGLPETSSEVFWAVLANPWYIMEQTLSDSLAWVEGPLSVRCLKDGSVEAKVRKQGGSWGWT